MKLSKYGFFLLALLVAFTAVSCVPKPKTDEGLKDSAGTSTSTATAIEEEPIQEDTVKVGAVIETKFGDIELELYPDVAPMHVENFKDLANDGFYDGTIFHRVIPGFMVQGGDPNTKGTDVRSYGFGGPSHNVDAEFNNISHVRGILSMARGPNPNSAGSQFFIVVKDSTFLDKKYTVFGRVVSGMDVADKIVGLPRNRNDLPHERVEMKVRIVE